ncbi:Metallothionein-like protein type 3 [Hibiscus syriacus]|uniref:Metallothionein-like protein type 3 n=1 Tax=Hibiscus syriacus TaxID=106335 RepID=A0A6A2ZIM0_HIBSY|nr:Metallothionein-like protein type 3 [Hibiscus syriacus]
MSDKCGNCDCADKSQCMKKGNTFVIETEKSYISTVEVVEALAENDGKCKCKCHTPKIMGFFYFIYLNNFRD